MDQFGDDSFGEPAYLFIEDTSYTPPSVPMDRSSSKAISASSPPTYVTTPSYLSSNATAYVGPVFVSYVLRDGTRVEVSDSEIPEFRIVSSPDSSFAWFRGKMITKQQPELYDKILSMLRSDHPNPIPNNMQVAPPDVASVRVLPGSNTVVGYHTQNQNGQPTGRLDPYGPVPPASSASYSGPGKNKKVKIDAAWWKERVNNPKFTQLDCGDGTIVQIGPTDEQLDPFYTCFMVVAAVDPNLTKWVGRTVPLRRDAPDPKAWGILYAKVLQAREAKKLRVVKAVVSVLPSVAAELKTALDPVKVEAKRAKHKKKKKQQKEPEIETSSTLPDTTTSGTDSASTGIPTIAFAIGGVVLAIGVAIFAARKE